MTGLCSLFGLLVVTWLTFIDGKGIDLGLCSNENVVCACGTGGLQIQIPIKRCTDFYRWKPYCRACEDYNKEALCSQFQHCFSCNAVKDGGCSACPVGRYGQNCQGVCQCQNGGICDKVNGKCECPAGYSGQSCEKHKQTACGPPPSLRHGTVSGATQGSVEGNIVRYRCDLGYTLVGPAQKRCEKYGRWSGGEARCEYMCVVPASQPNMKVTVEPYATMATGDNPKGVKLVRRVKFACDSGFLLKGLPELNCLPTSQWNGKVPRCEPSSSCSKPAFNGDISPESATYSVGVRVSFTCTSGFTLAGARSLSCLQGGKWSASVPNCVGKITTPSTIMCLALTAPDNGKMTPANGNRLVGQKVEFSCDVGFILTGSTERQCGADSTWSGSQPRCIKVITCSDPGTPKNGLRVVSDVTARITGRGRGPGARNRLGGNRSRMSGRNMILPDGQFSVNTLIRFSCKTAAYRLVGSSTRTCQASGQWSGLQPKCAPVCGKSPGVRPGQITNGEVSKQGEYPWQVMLAQGRPGGLFRGVCGATLISEEWVVTAAHCVTGQESTKILPLEDFKMYVGKYFRDDSKDDSFVQEFTVSEIRLNPNYDPLLLDSDIALIRLSRPAELTERVMPICLADNSANGQSQLEDLIKSGSFITVSGWGETENRTDADVLLKTRLMAISNTECEDKYAATSFPLTVTSKMFCAGHDDGRSDTCFGDSGGPAVSFVGGGEGRLWYLVGVVSWGSPLDCGVPMQYSGFTRVSNFLDYIYTNAEL